MQTDNRTKAFLSKNRGGECPSKSNPIQMRYGALPFDTTGTQPNPPSLKKKKKKEKKRDIIYRQNKTHKTGK
jgi:ABC-type thiamine transport system substrate-binding protein